MKNEYDEYRDTPLWRVVAAAVAELETTREISVATAPDYVIGYICRRLVDARTATPEALAYEP